MKSPMIMLVALGTAGTLTLAAASAEAQKIRTFGEETETQVDGDQAPMAIPGAPAPQQQAPQQQVAAPEQEEGADDERPIGSYQISVHGSAGPGQHTGSTDAHLQQLLGQEHTELYRGIIPGQRDEVAHLAKANKDGEARTEPNPITWVGFQPDDERTRVFFQSPRPIEYHLEDSFEEDGQLVVIFGNARIAERNFSRFIDTSHFGRTVERIEASETDAGDVEVRLQVNDDVEPSISTQGGYLYLDFPHSSEAERSDDDSRAAAEPTTR